MIQFENYELRKAKINSYLNKNGIADLQEALDICTGKKLDIYKTVKSIQSICFDDACYAYIAGASVAIKKELTSASEIALELGEGLQAFCVDGSVADERQVGVGHGKLASMILSDDVKCFCFLAGHESFAAAEGAIGIANSANKVRKTPLKVILNGLGKDAAEIICILRSPADSDAFQSGRYAEHNGRPKTLDLIV